MIFNLDLVARFLFWSNNWASSGQTVEFSNTRSLKLPKNQLEEGRLVEFTKDYQYISTPFLVF